LSSLEEVRVASGGDRVPVHLMNDTWLAGSRRSGIRHLFIRHSPHSLYLAVEFHGYCSILPRLRTYITPSHSPYPEPSMHTQQHASTMANILESQTIDSYPIGDGLDFLRARLHSSCLTLGLSSSEFIESFTDGGTVHQLISRLLLMDIGEKQNIALQRLINSASTGLSQIADLPAAESLPSRHGPGTLSTDLISFQIRLIDGKKDILSLAPLLQEIQRHAPDRQIWEAAYDLVAAETNARKESPNPPTTFAHASSTILHSLWKNWTNHYVPDSLNVLESHHPGQRLSMGFVLFQGLGVCAK
jgi:hypothetical protein